MAERQGHRAPSSPGGKPAILFVNSSGPHPWSRDLMRLDERVGRELAGLGFVTDWTTDWNSLTHRLLRRVNVVVTYSFEMTDPRIGPGPRVPQQVENLRRYVEEGGGLFITGPGGEGLGRYEILTQNLLLKQMGAEVLQEQVYDPETLHRLPHWAIPFSWTDAITPHPLTDGVTGLWYPTRGDHSGATGMNPVVTDANWKVLATGRPSARSFSMEKFVHYGFSGEGDTFKSSPPLLAVRHYGKGRIVLWPLPAPYTFIDGYHEYSLDSGIIMDGDVDGRKSQAARLIYSLLGWLAEPSVSAGRKGFAPRPRRPRAQPRQLKPMTHVTEIMNGYVQIDYDGPGAPHSTPVNWRIQKPMSVRYRDTYLGLVGAMSTLSGGRAPPQELIDAARRAGYRFIVFTEDLATLTPGGWDQLEGACLRNTDGRFRAVQGLRFVDALDEELVVFGDIGYPPDAWRDPDHPQRRIRDANQFARGYRLPPPIAIVNLHRNGHPGPVTRLRNIHGMSISTYENGKLTDDALSDYILDQQLGNCLFPLAVHFVKSPTEVEAARKEGFQTCIQAASLDELISQIDDFGWSHGRVYKPSFITTGPRILHLDALNWGSADLATPSRDRLRLQIAVSADAGLAAVEVLDNGNVIRRFLPKRRSFRVEIDDYHDRQHDYIVRASDRNGAVAYSWDRCTEVQECWHRNCTDNWNDLAWGKWWPEKIRPVRGIESYLPDKNPADSTPRWPLIMVHEPGEQPGNYAAYSAPKRTAIVSRFGWVVDYPIDEHVYKNCSGGIRETFFTGRSGGIDLRIIEGSIRVNHTIETEGPFPVRYSSGTWASRRNCAVATDGARSGAAEILPAGDARARERTVEVGPGGYAAVFAPLVGLIPLCEGCSAHVIMEEGRSLLSLGPTRQPRQLQAGSVLTYLFATIIGDRTHPENHEEMEEIRTKMGLSGAPAYSVKPGVGTVLDTRLVLHLQASRYGWRGKLTRANLPITLPVVIDGLNERWSAGIWYRGENTLLVPEWKASHYTGAWYPEVEQRWRTRTDDIQRFGVLEGRGYLQLDTEGGDRDVFIGNLAVCDDPRMFLTVVVEQKSAHAMVHNPTDAAAVARIEPGPGFDLFGTFEKTVTVPAGRTERVRIA